MAKKNHDAAQIFTLKIFLKIHHLCGMMNFLVAMKLTFCVTTAYICEEITNVQHVNQENFMKK